MTAMTVPLQASVQTQGRARACLRSWLPDHHRVARYLRVWWSLSQAAAKHLAALLSSLE